MCAPHTRSNAGTYPHSSADPSVRSAGRAPATRVPGDRAGERRRHGHLYRTTPRFEATVGSTAHRQLGAARLGVGLFGHASISLWGSSHPEIHRPTPAHALPRPLPVRLSNVTTSQGGRGPELAAGRRSARATRVLPSPPCVYLRGRTPSPREAGLRLAGNTLRRIRPTQRSSASFEPRPRKGK